VAIRVIIESQADEARRAQEGLDRVKVELNKKASVIHATTSLKHNSEDWSNHKLTIDYYISMPRKLAATLSQRYGNIHLPEKNEGKYNLAVRYGNLKAGSFAEALTIDARYSNIALDDVKDLRMELRFCVDIKLGDVRELDIDNRYGNITAGNVNNLSVRVRYGTIQIDALKEKLSSSDLHYSALTIKKLDADFQNIDAEGHYSTLQLSVSPRASFRIDARSMKYGKVNINGLKITNSNIENKTNHSYQINGGGNQTIRFDGNNYSTLRLNAL
jgi:hypothetical protein